MAIVTATLARRISADKLCEMEEGVVLGKVYRVDLATRRPALMFNTEYRITHIKEIINVYPNGGWLPYELLDIGGAPE